MHTTKFYLKTSVYMRDDTVQIKDTWAWHFATGYGGDSQLCSAGYYSLSTYMYELFFQKATKLLRHIVIKLFGPK